MKTCLYCGTQTSDIWFVTWFGLLFCDDIDECENRRKAKDEQKMMQRDRLRRQQHDNSIGNTKRQQHGLNYF